STAWLSDIMRHFIHQTFQRMRSCRAEPPLPVTVRVQVQHRFLLELVCMSLGPFGGAEQALLFSIPGTNYNRPPGLPPLLAQLAKRVRCFHDGDHPARGIVRAVDPRIVVIAVDDPFVWIIASSDPADHVVKSLQRPVERHLQMYSRKSRPNVIGD